MSRSSHIAGLKGKLTVTVHRGQNLKDVELLGKQDPYVELWVEKEKFKTKVHNNGGTAPVWEQSFIFNLEGKEEGFLHVHVYDKETFSDRSIGRADIHLKSLKIGETAWYNIVDKDNFSKVNGQISMTITFVGTGYTPPAKTAAAATTTTTTAAAPAAYTPGAPVAVTSAPAAAYSAPVMPTAYGAAPAAASPTYTYGGASPAPAYSSPQYAQPAPAYGAPAPAPTYAAPTSPSYASPTYASPVYHTPAPAYGGGYPTQPGQPTVAYSSPQAQAAAAYQQQQQAAAAHAYQQQQAAAAAEHARQQEVARQQAAAAEHARQQAAAAAAAQAAAAASHAAAMAAAAASPYGGYPGAAPAYGAPGGYPGAYVSPAPSYPAPVRTISGRFYLSSHHNSRLSCSDGARLSASPNKAGWEVWTISDCGNGRVMLTSYHNSQLSVSPHHQVSVTPSRGQYEQWTITPSGGKYLITAWTGNNLGISDRGEIYCNNRNTGGWELFDLLPA